MKSIEAPKAIKTWRIICAAQSEPDYDEERQVLCYAGDHTWDEEYLLLDGGHCSCYDWDDVTWDATVYSSDELEKLAMSKLSGHGCYEDSERKFWEMVCVALGFDRLGEGDSR